MSDMFENQYLQVCPDCDAPLTTKQAWREHRCQQRVLLVFDGTAWFIRHVRVIEHDLDRDEKVYRCDQHIAGPLTAEEARNAFAKLTA